MRFLLIWRRATTAGAALALVVLLGGCGEGSGGGRQFLSIGTAGTGGIYYPLGGAIASRLSVGDPDRQYTAEVTGGSVENMNRVAQGAMDIGFSMATTVYEAYHGGAGFDRPLSNLRVVAPLYANVVHVVVPDNSADTSVADFRGRRVSVGAPGSGTEQLAKQLLLAYDITYDDADIRYLSFRESVNALRDGAIDGAIICVGYPASSVLEVTTTGVARLLPVDSTHIAVMSETYSYYAAGTIPEGTYPRMESDVPTVAVMNWLVASDSLDGAVVTRLLDVLRDDREDLIRVNAMAEQIDLEALSESPILLHEAAQTWLNSSIGRP
jgi:TRAP transporter TAXI family solute receptor